MKRLLIVIGLMVATGGMVVVLASAFNLHERLKRHEESVQCGNIMCSIGCVAVMWANDDKHTNLPSDLISMSNELVIPRILICPGDHSRRPAASWASFTTNDSSYEIVTPGLRAWDSNGVFLRCKIHGHLGYGDATVFDGERRRTKVFQ